MDKIINKLFEMFEYSFKFDLINGVLGYKSYFMESELDILIAKLQKEVDFFVNEQNACLDVRDYLGAHQFELALGAVRRKLKMISELKSPLLYKINLYQKAVEVFEKEEEKIARMKSLCQKKVDELSAQLEQDKIVSKPQIDGDELLTAFSYLLEGKITTFDLLFDEKPYFKIVFDAIEYAIRLTVSRIQPAYRNESFEKYELLKLRQIGFEMEEERLVLLIQPISETKATKLLEIVARITFDAFQLEANRQATIRYKI